MKRKKKKQSIGSSIVLIYKVLQWSLPNLGKEKGVKKNDKISNENIYKVLNEDVKCVLYLRLNLLLYRITV